MIKRSISIYGHSTSVALEPEFWAIIDVAVVQKGTSFARFICELDTQRVESGTLQNLASYLRVWCLKRAQSPE